MTFLKAVVDGLKQQSLNNTLRAICIINSDVAIWFSSPEASTVKIVLHFQQNQVPRIHHLEENRTHSLNRADQHPISDL